MPLTGRKTAWICAALLALFATLSYLAASTKSATYDETLHAPAAWTHLRYGDFRVNPEHPPLWKFLAALPLLTHPLQGAQQHDRSDDDVPGPPTTLFWLILRPHDRPGAAPRIGVTFLR